MKDIFTVVCYQAEKKQDTVLSLIVKAAGSAPRGTGSLMLTGKDGRLAGTVGGGAVEYDAVKQSLALLAEQKPFLIKEYALDRSGEVGMVCGGDVTVLFLLLRADDPAVSALAGAVLAALSGKAAGTLSFYSSGRLPVLNAPENGPETPLLTLPLPVGERAILFGGGHIAAALCPLLTGVGFRVTVMDCRAEYADRKRFPLAEEVICAPYTGVNALLGIGEEDYIVIMTNGHAFDYEVEEQILRTDTAYVGVIGSRSKTKAVNEKLLAAGIPEERLSFVHTPIGTPIKAVTPEEIAVSIAGEMILERALRRERAGQEPSHTCPMH